MKKFAALTLLILVLVTTIVVNDKSIISVEEAPAQASKLLLEESPYSYEFYTSEESKVSNGPVVQKVKLEDSVTKESQFKHQPTPFEEASELLEIELNLPTQVLPGVEYIETEEKPFFNGTNEGKRISVVPGVVPLLISEEPPQEEQDSITVY